VLFPELVRIQHDPGSSLRLWQRSTLIFCALLFPLAVILAYYSELVVTTLFTAKFLPALPIFHVYLFWIIRRCFSFDELLRTKGKTSYMMIGSAFALIANVVLAVLLYRQVGLVGPSIAFVAAQVLVELYYADRAAKLFNLTFSLLLDWRGLLGIVAACASALPILIAADHLPVLPIARAVAASSVFLAACWFVAYHLGVKDIGRIASVAISLLGRRT
jgi:O-antigen/teichoic acid export membrane protein